MALTPEDVVNKRFQPTKFREGYDQDEVDDFLDEIVLELRRLNLENDDLKLQLAAAEARVPMAVRPTTCCNWLVVCTRNTCVRALRSATR